MKERQHQQSTRVRTPQPEHMPPKGQQASRLPAQDLQHLLQSRGRLPDLPTEELEALAAAVGNGSLLALLQSSGAAPAAIWQPEPLPPERWETENKIETSPPELFPLEQWPGDTGWALAPSPPGAVAERSG